MIKQLETVYLNTLDPSEVKVCRNCGLVWYGDEGCPFCSFLVKAWKGDDPKPSIEEMLRWVHSPEGEEGEPKKKGFWD